MFRNSQPNRLILLCLLLGSLFISTARAQDRPLTVGAVEFDGLERVSESRANEWMQLSKGDPFSDEILVKHARQLLRGFASVNRPFTRIDSITYSIPLDHHQVHIHVYLREGKTVLLDQLDIQHVDSTWIHQIKKRFETKRDEPVDASRIETDLDDAIKELEHHGYPFARFELSSLGLTDTSDMTIRYRLSPGPRITIEEIRLVGNKVTQNYVILRELGIETGDLYIEEKVARIPTRLMRLGMFRRVDPPQVYYIDNSAGGLLIGVEEGPSSRFDGVLGYNPGTDSEGGYFTGLLDISLGNLLGTGRALKAHWQKRDRRTQELAFHYKEPWLFGFPVHVGAGFEQLIQDTTYVQREISLDVNLPLSENLSIVSGVGRVDISPDSLQSFSLGIPKSKSYTASIGFQYDSRDDLINPSQGIYTYSGIKAGRKQNLGPDSLLQLYDLKETLNNNRYVLDLEFYFKLFSHQVTAVALHGRQIKSSERRIPLPDLYRLGGATSLRGYREDQFRGQSIAWMNMEYRYLLGRRSRVFVFVDGGYVSVSSDNESEPSFYTGYGLGVRLETGLGILGVDYGLGKGDDLANGKVHVGLINEF